MRFRSAACAVFVLLLSAFNANAGDVATFVNLGFSDNSASFMFGYYGVDTDSNRPFSEIYTIDVKANRFVPGGEKRASFQETLQPGQDAAGALYSLLGQTGPLTRKFGINHLRQGRLLYVLLNGDTMKDVLEFRDFNTTNSYTVRLLQRSTGTGAGTKSAFHIELSITRKEGRTSVYTIGLPDFYRDKVLGYRIRQIILSPDEKHMVFIIERDHHSPGGKSVRYMAETVRLF